jgi:NtrC-family two-component system response regulator AlgB
VRELRNAIERAVLLCNDEQIGIEYLPMKLAPPEAAAGIGDLISLEAVEELHIRRVLAATRSIEEACRVLGMDSVTLWRRRKKYAI